MGLGGFPAVSLADARRARDEAEKLVRQGIDPIANRDEERQPAEAAPTFGGVAEELVNSIAPGLRNAKHVAQWRMTLSIERDAAGEFVDSGYCVPLRDKAVSEISTDDVLSVLKPIWLTKPETASRVRGRIERVLDAAKVRGLRSGENPAVWRGHLALLLPKRQVLQRGHHAAMPYRDLPAFVERLRLVEGVSALALEFVILTAARSGEVRGARWCEISLESAVWTVPPERMKAGREHRVPLSGRALVLLEEMAGLRHTGKQDELVFPGVKAGQPLSVMALNMLLRRLKVDVTTHGFRSAFRDWCGEETNYPREIAEAALAHVIGDKSEQAYRRGDALEKRRHLMAAWDKFVGQPAEPSRLIENQAEQAS
jgi:integrase